MIALFEPSLSQPTVVTPYQVENGGDDGGFLSQFIANNTVPGDTVGFPPGALYNLETPFILQPNRRYVGGHNWPASSADPPASNAKGAIFRMAPGANLDECVVSSAYLQTGSGKFNNNPIEVEGFCIDGNKAAQTGGAGFGLVLASWNDSAIRNGIFNARGHGLVISGQDSSGNVFASNTYQHWIERNIISGCGGHGIWAPNVTDGYINHNIVANNGLTAIVVPNCSGWDISDNHLWNIGVDGIDCDAWYATQMSHNYLEGFGAATGLSAGVLSTASGTSAGTVSLAVAGGVLTALASGATITLTSGTHTQNFTTSSAVAVGATSIPISSATPNFSYPIGTTVLTMTWSALTTYPRYSLVVQASGLWYSLVDGNIGNTPASDGGVNWAQANGGNSAVYGIAGFNGGQNRAMDMDHNDVSIGHVEVATIPGINYRAYICQAGSTASSFAMIRGNRAGNEYPFGQLSSSLPFRISILTTGALAVNGMAIGSQLGTNSVYGTFSAGNSIDAGVTAWSLV